MQLHSKMNMTKYTHKELEDMFDEIMYMFVTSEAKMTDWEKEKFTNLWNYFQTMGVLSDKQINGWLVNIHKKAKLHYANYLSTQRQQEEEKQLNAIAIQKYKEHYANAESVKPKTNRYSEENANLVSRVERFEQIFD